MATNKTEKFIIRADRAGVFYAEISERRGSEADLLNVRRIHSWEGATDCIGLAGQGLDAERSRMTASAPSMTVLGVIEVIPVSDAARAILDEVKVWTA